jgi:hypothetical protein
VTIAPKVSLVFEGTGYSEITQSCREFHLPHTVIGFIPGRKTMKYSVLISIFFCLLSVSARATEPAATHAYINQNIGFNVPGYKYTQSEFPCKVDKILVEEITKRGTKEGITIEPVATIDKIRNGVVPVIALDIEQMVLGSGKESQFGTKVDYGLPKMQVTAAVIKGNDIITAKHTCAIVNLNEFTPSNNVLDLGTPGVTYCKAMRKCIRELSKDVIDWAAPQL